MSEATSQKSESQNNRFMVQQEQMHTTSSPHEDFRLTNIQSAVFESQGRRAAMEDTHLVHDNVDEMQMIFSQKASFYAVFDGHGNEHAAKFAMQHLLQNFLTSLNELKEEENPLFEFGFSFRSLSVRFALRNCFTKTDLQFRDLCQENDRFSSGTTAIAVVIVGRQLFVANAGDCRAVLCRNGKAVDMSNDHDPSQNRAEYERIHEAGGYLDKEGYLNGIVNMSRAVGDWNYQGLKQGENGELGPLISEPEVMIDDLTGEDEFMIIASDGLFKKCSSQDAVDLVRQKLLEHTDLKGCATALARYGMSQIASRGYLPDNTTVVVVSFEKEVITAAPVPSA